MELISFSLLVKSILSLLIFFVLSEIIRFCSAYPDEPYDFRSFREETTLREDIIFEIVSGEILVPLTDFLISDNVNFEIGFFD